MNITHEKTVIVPRDISIAHFTAYAALNFAGIVGSDDFVKVSAQPPLAGSSWELLEGSVFNLYSFTPKVYLGEEIINYMHPGFRRWVRYLAHDQQNPGRDEIKYALAQVPPGCDCIGELYRSLVFWIRCNITLDPWRQKDASWTKGLTDVIRDAYTAPIIQMPSDISRVPLAFFPRTVKVPDIEIKGTTYLRLPEGNVLGLIGRHIRIGVVGDPGVGKSTMCSSLQSFTTEVLLHNLGSRCWWPQPGVNCQVCNLDLGTPTVGEIGTGQGQDRELLRARKRPWTVELLQEALAELRRKEQLATISYCDMPGLLSDYTRKLLTHLDAAIVLAPTGEWDQTMDRWLPALKELGVHVVSRIAVHPPGNGYSSIATNFRRGVRLSGRVSGLFRAEKSWDLFVQQLATILLLDILPAQFGSVYKSTEA